VRCGAVGFVKAEIFFHSTSWCALFVCLLKGGGRNSYKKSELGKGSSRRSRLTSAVSFEGSVLFSLKAIAFVHDVISLNEFYIVNLGFGGICFGVQN